MIRTNINKETKPDFEEMWSEVKEDIQEQDAEQDIINRVPELKKLIDNIDKATTTWLSATYELESAIQQYQRAEKKLDATITDIRGKVDGINDHIDKVLKDAPTKLQVSVNVADADWQKIQALLDKQREWVISQAQATVREVNTMLAEERKKTLSRYKEYDGCYLGHYAQWFFWFFFIMGFFIFDAVVVMLVGKWL